MKRREEASYVGSTYCNIEVTVDCRVKVVYLGSSKLAVLHDGSKTAGAKF